MVGIIPTIVGIIPYVHGIIPTIFQNVCNNYCTTVFCQMHPRGTLPVYRNRSRSQSPVNAGSASEPDSLSSDTDEHGWGPLWDTEDDPGAFIRPPTDDDAQPPTVAEVMLAVLEWYASHKATYTSTADVFELSHLYALESTEHWETDIETGKTHRKRRYYSLFKV